MKFSLRLNNDLPSRQYIALAQAAESAGFDQIWVSNDLFLRSNVPILTNMALATDRIHVGTGILNPYTIHPVEMAMLAATLDEMSDNRFLLGIAAGASDFLEWVGIEQVRPLAAMRETILAVRQLLQGERAAPEGPFPRWHEEAYLRFTPPRVTPIYLGAMGPKMLALAGELADGVLPLLFPPELFFDVRPHVERGIAVRSPQRVGFDFAACIWVSLSEDRAAARHVLAQKIAYYGHALGDLIYRRLGVGQEEFMPIAHALQMERDEAKAISLVDERMLRIAVVGGPNEVIERLEPLVAAGVEHLSFGPPLGPEPLRAVQLLGEVVRHFGGRPEVPLL